MMNSVAERSADSSAQVASAAKARALMGGTEAMRAAGQTYLPKFSAESKEAYDERLALSWLFNGYRKTVRDMSGRVFDKPVAATEGVSARMEEWLKDVDLQGRDLSTFSREVFEDGLSGPGISYIMVDAPRRGDGVTQAQARAQNLRPYLVHLRAEDVIGWRKGVVNNAQALAQIRIAETITEEDPEDEFKQKNVEQIRVLDRGDFGVTVRLYRKGDKGWVLHDGPYPTGMREITVVPFYANRTDFFMGAPILDDLADVNIAHWQSQSDQRHILHVARVPILFGAGIPDDTKITISTSTATVVSDPAAKLSWVEHSGQAIGAGRQDLKDLEFQMETHGLQLLVAKAGQSATGEALDAAKETTILAMTADQLQDSLEQALSWMAEYAGEPSDVSVFVNKDFGAGIMDAQELQLLLGAVNTGNLSRETFLQTLVARGVIADSVIPEDEAERIDAEGGAIEDAA